jgi:general secretion pathway protein C
MKKYNRKYLLKNQKLVVYLNAILGLLLLIAFLVFVRDVMTISFSPKKKNVVREAGIQIEGKHSLQDYKPILVNNPFGLPAVELRPLSNSTMATSSSEVSLIGTVSGQSSLSYAIFVNKTGEQEGFMIGDSVFGLGILNKVEKDRIFIGADKNTLEMHLADVASVKEVHIPQRIKPRNSGFSRKVSDGIYSIDQRKIQRAIANPKELMTEARLLPNIIEGRQHGFVLNEIKTGGIYDSLGLRNGDVLLRINEFDISNPEYALQAFTALRGMERVQLDILRNGSKMTLTYQIN